jgi:hypothetical protein
VFEIKHQPMKFASLVEIADRRRKVPKTGHRTSGIRRSTMCLPLASDVFTRTRPIRNVSDVTFVSQRALSG